MAMFRTVRHLSSEEREDRVWHAADDRREVVYEPRGQCSLTWWKQCRALDTVRLVR